MCMECAHACDAVKLEFRKFGYSLYERIKNPKMIEVMVYILLVAVITFGYAFAPLMIVGGLSHVLEFFFIEYYRNIVNGFSQAFGLGIQAEPLAKRGDHWLHIFRIFLFIVRF